MLMTVLGEIRNEIDCFNLKISNSQIEIGAAGPSMCNVIMTRKIFIFMIENILDYCLKFRFFNSLGLKFGNSLLVLSSISLLQINRFSLSVIYFIFKGF